MPPHLTEALAVDAETPLEDLHWIAAELPQVKMPKSARRFSTSYRSRTVP